MSIFKRLIDKITTQHWYYFVFKISHNYLPLEEGDYEGEIRAAYPNKDGAWTIILDDVRKCDE